MTGILVSGALGFFLGGTVGAVICMVAGAALHWIEKLQEPETEKPRMGGMRGWKPGGNRAAPG